MPKFDLIQRTSSFSINVRKHLRVYKFNSLLVDDFRQLIRSSGSIGSNYIEANQNLGTQDFKMRIRISKKEATETVYWCNILAEVTQDPKFREFEKESKELVLIFVAILKNLK